MQRQRGELVPIGEVVADLDGPVQAIRDASPQALHHFTRFDQVNQLVSASEADPERGFMVRMMALCSLPRTNPGNQHQYKRVNGPFKLIMSVSGDHKLPFGNLPRLLLAWISTEAVRTQSREISLGRSLSGFMRKLGMDDRSGSPRGDRTRLRNQMNRLFGCSVQLIYEDERVTASMTSPVASRAEFWWNERKPDEPVLFNSKIRLGEDLFNEIINHPVPLDMNTLKALKRSTLGLDLYLWAQLPDLRPPRSAAAHLEAGLLPVRSAPGQGQRQQHRSSLPVQGSARVEENQDGLAGVELHDGQGGVNHLALDTGDRATQSRPTRSLISPFQLLSGPSAASLRRVGPLTSNRSERLNPLFPQAWVILGSFPR